jgi:putative nucleotidyltransferase with HDIG domain
MMTHPTEWTPETERAYKEILYRFMGEIQSTKAALYLKTPDDSWTLATQYGFGRRDRLEEEFPDDHVMVRMVRAFGDEPRHYNDSNELGGLAAYLGKAGTTRMMLVPLNADGELFGFVDVRDKGRQRPFNEADLDIANAIGVVLTRLAAETISFGQTTTQVVEKPVVQRVVPAEKPIEPGVEPEALLDEVGFDEIYTAASDRMADPRIVTVALTTASGKAASTVVLHRAGSEVDHRALAKHQNQAMQQASVPVPPRRAWTTEMRRLPGQANLVRSPVIASSVLLEGAGSSLAASVVVDTEPGIATQTLERLEQQAVAANDRFWLRISRRSLARRLLQPGDRRYPELVAHSLGVSRLTWSLAKALGFDEQMTEEAALAGLLHDVGMRELDYDRLYMHPTPGLEDRRTYRMHVEVGERIVRVEGFSAIADAVRHHHERWDGNGYPDGLGEDEIPLLARVVHAAEVFDLFTAANSYRPAVSQERAMAILTRAAGHQFDPEVVDALAKVVQ